MNVQGPEGMVFAGKYRIVRLIGKGGMANVYLATDTVSGMNVAIKILKPEFSNDEEFIKRFDTEARAVSSLSHSNIVKVLGVGHEGNFRYIVQEYVDGITVKDLINQNGHIDWRVAVPIVIQVGMALDHAHKNGIVHRDIKPHNILITRDRIAKITDFGIARAATSNTITMSSGGALGSVHYFSPEQARGGNVGPSSDIYSVGVMLFEMVTGRVPFDGDTNVAVAVKHLQEKPPLASSFVPGIPAGLDAIILKCMQKTPERRYSSVRQMVAELDALMVDPNGVYGVIGTNNDMNGSDEINTSFRQDPNYGKVKELETTIESRRHARFRDNVVLILIIVLIVGSIIGIGSLVVKTINSATKVEKNSDYTVKNYVGLTLNEVIDELEDNNVKYEIVYEVTEDYEAGIVIEQSIAEGVTISTDSNYKTLTLTVSSAPESIVLSDYTGLNYEDASSTLTGLGLAVTVRSEPSEDIDEGLVIRTEPAANTQMQPGDTVVVVYAVKPTSCVVPDLTGQTLEQARTMLEENDLVIGQIEGDASVITLPESQQYVLLTDPEAGLTVPRRSSIKIFVGTYDDVQRGGTPTPTPAAINVSPGVIGSGTVTGGGQYQPGTTVTLTATAASGYQFDHWQDAYGNVMAYSSNYTFSVSETNNSYTAVFTAIPTPSPTPTEAQTIPPVGG